MTQYARPERDTKTSLYWGSGPYWPNIDEVTPDDGDLCGCGGNGSGTIEVGLSELADPISDADHTVRFRAWQQNNANQRTLAVYLVQGTTVISTYAAFDLVKGTATQYEWTLSSAEADSITDYTDLRLRFTSGGDTSTPSGDRSEVYVSWAELEVPTPVDSAPRVTQRSIEVGYTLPEEIVVAHHIIEVAWQPYPIFYVSARVIEVAYLRLHAAGRTYGVAIGHF